MRLLDKVSQCDRPVVLAFEDRTVSLPGAGRHAQGVRDCRLRYILDAPVRDVCLEIQRDHADLLDARDRLLRLPAESLWVEWPMAGFAAGPAQRLEGVLIQSTAGGRSGRAVAFWDDGSGATEVAQASLVFDLDQRLAGEPAERLDRVGIRSDQEALDPHALVEIDGEWRDVFRSTRPDNGQCGEIARLCAQQLWRRFVLALAFTRLLAGGRGIAARRIERKALNAARGKRRRPELLDHVEIRLELGAATDRHSAMSASRSPCRRHFVRGHLVRRAGHVFWRASHFRGDPSRLAVEHRTTRVTAAPGYRFDGLLRGHNT